MTENARTGKIARCPLVIREEVNRRLLDGESGPKILRWLNEHPDVLRVLDEYFGEEPVSSQNLSEWRQGGYQEFLDRRKQIERTKDLAGYAAKLAEGSQGAAGGNAAMLAGHFLEIFESLDVARQVSLLKEKPANFPALVEAFAKLEKSQADRVKASAAFEMVSIQKQRAEQAEDKLKLEVDKHKVKTCELFIKWADDKRAREILDGSGRKEVKMEKLRQLMFPMDEPLDPTPLNG